MQEGLEKFRRVLCKGFELPLISLYVRKTENSCNTLLQSAKINESTVCISTVFDAYRYVLILSCLKIKLLSIRCSADGSAGLIKT